jgi:hypothetical protein
MEERLSDFDFDFLPKESNRVYHVVSMDWFKSWKRYVGLEQVQEKPEESKMEAREQFRNLNKTLSKPRNTSKGSSIDDTQDSTHQAYPGEINSRE